MDSREVFLAHHGILGQQWGHKNGPPYPLGASDHSYSEKKAGWRKSLAGGKATVAKIAKSSKGKVENALRKYKYRAEDKKRRLDDKEKKKIIDSGDPKKILDNKDKLTTEELRQAKEKADVALEIEKSKRAASKDKALNTLEALKNTANVVKDAANAGVALYDAYKKLKPKEKDDASDTESQKLLKSTLEKIGKTKLTDENMDDVLKEINKSIDYASVIRDAEVMSKDPSIVSVKSKVKKSK